MSVGSLKKEILEWAEAQGKHYHNSSFDLFVSTLEWKDIELPSGKAEYVDIDTNVGDGESLAIFSVAGTTYAFRGTYSSWGSDWDSGPYEVEKREVTIERWETL